MTRTTLQKPTKKRTKLDVARYRLDPGAFIREVIKAGPDEWQVHACGALIKHKRVSIAACHGVGKDTLAAWLIIWMMVCWSHPKIPCTAPTGHQLYDLLWSEIAKWWPRVPKRYRKQYELKADRFELKRHHKTWFAVARTARKETPEALAGIHADNVMIAVDEASGVPEVIFEVLEGAMTGPNCYELLIGNPTQPQGFFHASHHSDRRWYRMRIAAAAAYPKGFKPPAGTWLSDRVSPEYVDAMRRKYGEDSNVYRVRVLGLFPRSSDDQAIPLEWVDLAANREVPIGWWRRCPQRIVLGVDVARFGSDSTCVVARQGRAIVGAWLWHGNSVTETANKVKALAYRIQRLTDEPATQKAGRRPGYMPTICIDGVGVGAGVIDVLREDERLTVVDVQAGETSKDPDCYRKRDELWWDARWFYQDSEPMIAAGSTDQAITSIVGWTPQKPVIDQDVLDRLIGELATPKYKFSPDGRVVIESKDDVKKRLGGDASSPDVADAHNLTFQSVDEQKPKSKIDRYDEQREELETDAWVA